MISNGFSSIQNTWLISGIALLLVAVMFFLRGKTGLSLVILAAGGFVLRLLMVNTDPFLYDWDEQYHALVAKHLAVHPGTPTLYDAPLLPVDITRWAHNHIWLHKPPLFLWLIAASVKLFGTTPLAVKLPSIILSTLMIPALFYMMKRLAGERAAWLSALLLAAHSYSIQLVSGFRNTDHNDVIFSAFLLFTFWAWVKYTDTRRKRDAILTGVLIGCAVLVKWLPGMLVFIPWGLWMLQQHNRADKKLWMHFVLAFCAALVMVVPWYVRIFLYFPAEAAYEMNYNMLHFTIAIEGHDGPWYYHFDAIRELMGWILALLCIPGLFLFATRDTRQKRSLYITVAVLFFILFYTIAKTKMPLFVLPLVPFLLAGIALVLEQGIGFIAGRKVITSLLLAVFMLFVVDPMSIIINHSSLSELAWYRDEMKQAKADAERFLQVKNSSAEKTKRWVVFNYPENSRASFMFYTDDIAYNQAPATDTLNTIAGKGYHVAAIDNQFLPETYRNNPLITLIPGAGH